VALAMGSIFKEEIHVADVPATMGYGKNKDECPEVWPLSFLEEMFQIPKKILESLRYTTDNKHSLSSASIWFLLNNMLIGTKGFFL
jgi:hypothetical protein